MVMAPEHPLVQELASPEQRAAVQAYVDKVKSERDIDRAAKTEKTGVFTGAYAINPVNGEKIPIWIADYVLMGYGTGAIMAVPAHDERDYEFAKKFGLEIREVVSSPTGSSERGLRRRRNDDQLRPVLPECRPMRAGRKSSTWLEDQGPWPRNRQLTSSATGYSRASGTGASRFPSFIAR